MPAAGMSTINSAAAMTTIPTTASVFVSPPPESVVIGAAVVLAGALLDADPLAYRYVFPAAGILGGMTMLGLASWRLLEDPPANQYSRGLGVMFVAIGTGNLTTGIYAATRIPHERRRLERWEKARKDGITQIELAHFEGELQAARETRQGERLLVRWNGLAQGIGLGCRPPRPEHSGKPGWFPDQRSHTECGKALGTRCTRLG